MDLSGYSDAELMKFAGQGAPQGPGPVGGIVPLIKSQQTLDVFSPGESQGDLSRYSDEHLMQIAGGSPPAKPAQSDGFFSDLGANFQHGIQSANDLLSGNYQDIGRVSPTPKTQALADKLFPPGSEGNLVDAAHHALGNTAPSDWSGALLEKLGETPEGKALAVLGGVNPLWNAAATAMNRYGNPAISDAFKQAPQSNAGSALQAGLRTVIPGMDALTSPEGIHPDSLALMETVAGTLGLKKAASISDPTVSAIKGIINYLGQSGVPKSKPLIPTAADIRNTASQAYAAADQQGGILKPNITDSWINTASRTLPQTQAGKTILGESAPAKLVERMQALRGLPLTLQAAQEIYSALGDMMESHVDPLTGKLLAEGKQYLDIQNALWDSIENASPADVMGGKAGFDLWAQAKTGWAKSMRMSEVERIINRAADADNPQTVLKNGFRALKNNQKRFRGFSAAEKAAISHAAKTGILTGALKLGGSRLISSVAGAIGGAAGGGPLGAAIGTGAGAALATPLRMGANALQMRRAQKVVSAIAQVSPQSSKLIPLMQQGVQSGTKALPSAAEGAAIEANLMQHKIFPVRRK